MTRKQIREDFCPVCIAPVIAIAGGGIIGAGVLTEEEKNQRTKQILIWTGISIILSIIIWYIWIKRTGNCKTCYLP